MFPRRSDPKGANCCLCSHQHSLTRVHHFKYFVVLGYAQLLKDTRNRCFLYSFSNRIFSLLCVVLYYTACSDLLHTYFIDICSDIITTISFSHFGTYLLSLPDVPAPLRSAVFFSTCFHSTLLQYDNYSYLCLLRSA